MNSLFTSSWAKNVKPNAIALWNHEFKEIVNEGTRGRAAHPAYAKLMGMQSVKNLKGTMTPRYFATKVLKQLEKELSELVFKLYIETAAGSIIRDNKLNKLLFYNKTIKIPLYKSV